MQRQRWSLRRARLLVGTKFLLVAGLVGFVLVLWLFYVGELLAMRASRVTEYDADAAAASWGYAAPLATALEDLDAHSTEPTGRWAMLMAEHPPLRSRIDRLRD